MLALLVLSCALMEPMVRQRTDKRHETAENRCIVGVIGGQSKFLVPRAADMTSDTTTHSSDP